MSITPEEATAAAVLPADGSAGVLVGRIWDPSVDGPSSVVVREGAVHDVSETWPTVRDLCEEPRPAEAARKAVGRIVGDLDELLDATRQQDASRPRLLAPVDLQTLKAAGVTFAVSMMERLIEERVRGDLAAATRVREQILDEVGADLTSVRPGSTDAERLKEFLAERGLWSQYLEVGIGPDAEIFTKAPTLAAVGTLAQVGVPATSRWNNPEPEVALVVSSRGDAVGATLGNDVNLRDVEGRSALLLAQAKDNNASCALGPFVRLFDESFGPGELREVTVSLDVRGPEGFTLRDTSPMSQISREPDDLVAQLFRSHHYPDGVVLMLGTLFAPVADREGKGLGFTHRKGDVVRIAAPQLGTLTNEVQDCDECPPWTFGLRDLMTNLSRRGLL